MTADPGRERLLTYLADHLAGAAGALEMIGYLRHHAGDPAIQALMAALEGEIETDRRQLLQLAQVLGGGSQPLKETAAWLAEKASRIKLGAFGSAAGRLPLFEAVEALALGILGKVKLWDALAGTEPTALAAAGIDLTELRRRAVDQHDRVERERQRLARETFSAPPV